MRAILIDLIDYVEECQARAGLSSEIVADYAEHLADLPPIEVVRVGERYAVTDGWHRLAAYHQAHRVSVPCIVVDGLEGLEAASWRALAANLAHGLRRSSADKRKAVALALAHPYGGDMSHRDLAEHCGVSHTLVGLVARDLAESRNGDGSNPDQNSQQLATVASPAGAPRETTRETPRRPRVGGEIAGGVTRAEGGSAPSPGAASPWADAVRVVGDLAGHLSRTRREVRGQAEHETQVVRELVRALDDGLSAGLAACAAAEPVECPRHVAECPVCGGAGWVTTRQAGIVMRRGR